MDNTVNYAFPMVSADGTDPIVPDNLRAPLTAIDLQFKSFYDMFNKDSGVVTTNTGNSVIVMNTSDFTLNQVTVQKVFRTVMVHLDITNKKLIPGVSSGNIVNLNVGTFQNRWQAAFTSPMASTYAGPQISGSTNSAGGTIINTTPPGVDIAAGTQLTFAGMYLARIPD